MTPALQVANGDCLLHKGEVVVVASTHYCGPADGSGTVILEFTHGASLACGADRPVRVIA